MSERPLYRRHRLLAGEDEDDAPGRRIDHDLAERARRQLAKADAEQLAEGDALLESYQDADGTRTPAELLRMFMADLATKEGER